MNTEQLEGNWAQLKGKIKEKWGKFTNDDIAIIQGKKDQLLGKLREYYGYSVAQSEHELKAFMKDCKCSPEISPKNNTNINSTSL